MKKLSTVEVAGKKGSSKTIPARDRMKIALAGNPNSGKTSLFNALTGLRQKVGNFPGVTVDKKSGFTQLTSAKGEQFTAEVIDLPGTYSIHPRSVDEKILFDVLNDASNPDYPDVTLYVADASNLKRSLFLCTQLIDMGIPVVLVLNMMDMVRKKGHDIHVKKLSQKLGVPVVPVNARQRIGIDDLKAELAKGITSPQRKIVDSRQLAPEIVDEIKNISNLENNFTAFQLAANYKHLQSPDQQQKIKELTEKERLNTTMLQREETIKRYKAIGDILKDVLVENDKSWENSITGKLDDILTHKVYGLAIFLGVMFLVFQAIFSWSEYPMQLIETIFIWLQQTVAEALPAGILSDLLVNGVLAGLGGIVIFIPQIALLFAFIAILEDTGYMARVSFIMDKLLRKFGLNGRSVIPLISGMACAVPAIMATRTIANWKERLITIMVTPLMSCSARLPVYAVLISLVVPDKTIGGVFNLQGLTLMGLYLVGFLAAILSAWMMKFIIKARERSYFIMELPVYRAPRWSAIGITMLEKVKIFVWEAGKVILAISIILWVLSSFAPGDRFEQIEKKYDQSKYTEEYSPEVLNRMESMEKLENSYVGILGKTIEPVIRPLGFDWKIGIALVTSFAAREVFVGTMATLYSVGDEENTLSIRDKMMAAVYPDTGKKIYTPAVAFALMLFYAFAMQCMSTVAVVYTETRSLKWPIIQIIYMTGLAYLSAFLVYQLMS